MIDKQFLKFMTSYEATSSRIVNATFKIGSVSQTFIQGYAPDSSYPDKEVEEFYNSLQQKISSLPKSEELILMGDFNAKVGSDQHEAWPEVVGRYGLGNDNNRDLQLLQFCAINNLTICNTQFNHKPGHRTT